MRKSADAVLMVALRTEQKLSLTDVTAWACGRNAVICPTSILDDIEKMRQESDSRNESIVVCGPNATVAIIEHKPGTGPAAGFSLATVEAPLADVCQVTTTNDGSECVPGQQLAMLSAWSAEHDAKSVDRRLYYLTIDRIDRAGKDHAPTMYKCRSDADIKEVAGRRSSTRRAALSAVR